ncbi:hypothetical protein [Halosegnis sp.]
MRGSEPEPMVPEMPTETTSTAPNLVADGGERSALEESPEAPLVPDYT